MKKKKWIIPAVCLAAAAAVALFFLLRGQDKGTLSLATDRVSPGTITTTVTATGALEPVMKVEVGTQVSGIISKLFVDYNDEVKAGQVIAEMDKVTLESEYQSALSSLSSAKTEYDYRKKEYERMKTLHDKELVSDSDYDLALYNYQRAKSSYDQSSSSMAKVKRNLSYATITSPIDGVVISKAVEEGQTVAAGFSTPTLFTIANDLTKMQVIAAIDEADIGQVKEGQRVEFTVDAFPDDLFDGSVKQVRLEATTSSNVVTYEVVITADNPELKLKPGMTANVTVYTLEHDQALTVKSSALKFNPDPEILSKLGYEVAESAVKGQKVWLVNGKRLTPRSVEKGAATGDRTEILAGLDNGETVATGLQQTKKKEVPTPGSSERSPFAPSRPGGRR
ncbi:MAG: efflux RND transporter periplasmic adaptor subunit [Bacteroidales bacterium]|nr:efflux RND transporter periplasmic adaptor subunit [Bacteroidales bacterium]